MELALPPLGLSDGAACGCAEPSRLHTAGIKTIVGADGQTHWEQPPRAELDGRSTLTTAQKQQLYRDGYVSGRDSGVGGASV